MNDDELLAIINRLPTLQRRVVILRKVYEYTAEQICERLHITPEELVATQNAAERFLARELEVWDKEHR